jgi:hypothetical protein
MKKIIFLAVMAVFLSSVSSFGLNKIRWKDMDWKTYDTDHFRIYYYNGENLLAKLTAIYAEEAYENDTAILDYKPKNAIPLFIYENHIDFAATNITLDVLGEGTGGFTEPYKNRVVLPGTGSLLQLKQVIFHEVTHAIQFSILYGEGLRSYNVVYKDLFNPLWVMEGMAEYCADDMDSKGEMVLRDAVIHDRLIPLDKMEGFAHLEEVYLAYKEAQSVFMYMEQVHGKKVIAELIKYTGEESGIDGPFNKVFHQTFESFSRDWEFNLKKKYWAQVQGRDNPETYGPELTQNSRENFVYDQSPVFSHDGSKVAFISSRSGYPAVFVMNKNGRDIREVFSGYDNISTEGSSICWSYDNETIYFAATERGKRFIFKGPAGGGCAQKIEIPDIFNLASPAISPDEKFLAFTGNPNGFSDIYVYELATASVKKITDNIYENTSPAWSPDGKNIVFTEEREGFSRLAVVDLQTGKKDYITGQGKYNYETPSFISNDEILCSSDKNGIYNLYKIKFKDRAETQLTNLVGAALYPAYCDGMIVYSYYEDGCENIYKYIMDRDREFVKIPLIYNESLLPSISTPVMTTKTATAGLKVKPAVAIDFTALPDDLAEKKKIETGAAEVIKKNEPYSTLLTPDLLFVLFGYGTDTGLIGGGYVTASDMLGNHNLSALANYVPGNYSQFELQYLYLSLPIDVGLSLFYYQNVYQLYEAESGNFLTQLDNTQLGGAVSFKYPFNLYTSVELSLSTSRATNKYTNTQTNSQYLFEGTDQAEVLNSAGIKLLYDHSSWRDLWPYSGEEITLYAEASDKFFGGNKTYNLFEAEIKKYFDISFNSGRNMSLSTRFLFGATDGPDRPLFLFGGMDTLRGLSYGEMSGDRIGLMSLEFRYTLAKNIDADIWPVTFLMLKNIKLAFFNDMGFVRTGSLAFLTNEEMKNGMGLSMILDMFAFQKQFIPLKLEVAKRTDISDNIWKFYFSINTGF